MSIPPTRHRGRLVAYQPARQMLTPNSSQASLASHPIITDLQEELRPSQSPACWTPLIHFWNNMLEGISQMMEDANKVTPTLAMVLDETTLISPSVAEKLDDLKLLLRSPNLKTSHPNNLIALHVKSKKNDTGKHNLGQTEFFVDLDDIDNLPKVIQQKLNPADIYDGLHFMVPDGALPSGGLEGDQKGIKQWLGLENEPVDFDLHPKPKDQ